MNQKLIINNRIHLQMVILIKEMVEIVVMAEIGEMVDQIVHNIKQLNKNQITMKFLNPFKLIINFIGQTNKTTIKHKRFL